MLVATIVLSITGCMDRRQGATASRHPKDTLYTEQRAMDYPLARRPLSGATARRQQRVMPFTGSQQDMNIIMYNRRQ